MQPLRRAAGLALFVACASAPKSPPAVVPVDLQSANEVQVLLRGNVTQAKETARFRLALWRRSESFELAATDTFGRRAWMLSVGPREALWVDHRERTACPLPRQGGLAPLGLAAVPLDSVARILMGSAPIAALEDGSEFWDGSLRWHSVRDAGGKLRSWTLEEDGAARAKWVATPRGWVLTAPQSDTRIEAQIVAREPLRRDFVVRLVPPAGYRREGCENAAVP
jgi:hypothetical protein